MSDTTKTATKTSDPVDMKPVKAAPRPAARMALALRRLLLRWADRVIPAQFVLFDRSVGGATAACLATVTKLGVADLLGAGSRTASSLAVELGVDADALHRVLRGLAMTGVFSLDASGAFSNNRISNGLRADRRESMHNWIAYWATASNQAAWQQLDSVVATGEPGFPNVHGMSVWQWFNEHPDEGRGFAAAMRRITEIDAPDIVAMYPWPETGRICDLAGGAGALLSRILQARPKLNGMLVEAAVVLPEAHSVLSARGVADRVTLVEGDIRGSFDADADVYTLKSVLHDWDDQASLRILRAVHAAMPPGRTLVVIELLQERNVASYPASLTDLQMLVVCDRGRERSRDELQQLLRDAGFTPTTVHTSATGLGLVAATA